LLDLQRRGREFGDVNFVPVPISTAIFVASGAVSSASITSWQQLHAALNPQHALAATAAAAAAAV
jgi:hypothetical protein